MFGYRWESHPPDSGPLERVHSGFSRDLRRLDQFAAALTCWPGRQRGQRFVHDGRRVRVASVPAEAGLSSLKRLTIRDGRVFQRDLMFLRTSKAVFFVKVAGL